MDNEKHLKDLDLTISAKWDEIKKAYREQMKACHPDLHQNDGTQMIRVKVEEAKKINAAFGELKKFVTETGSFYGIPEEVVEEHLEKKRRTAEHGEQSSDETRIHRVPEEVTKSAQGPKIIIAEEEESTHWAREVLHASAAFLIFTILFVVAFRSGALGAVVKQLDSGLRPKGENTFAPAELPMGTTSKVIPAPASTGSKKDLKSKEEKSAVVSLQSAKTAEVAYEPIDSSGLLSFDEIQKRRARARLGFRVSRK